MPYQKPSLDSDQSSQQTPDASITRRTALRYLAAILPSALTLNTQACVNKILQPKKVVHLGQPHILDADKFEELSIMLAEEREKFLQDAILPQIISYLGPDGTFDANSLNEVQNILAQHLRVGPTLISITEKSGANTTDPDNDYEVTFDFQNIPRLVISRSSKSKSILSYLYDDQGDDIESALFGPNSIYEQEDFDLPNPQANHQVITHFLQKDATNAFRKEPGKESLLINLTEYNLRMIKGEIQYIQVREVKLTGMSSVTYYEDPDIFEENIEYLQSFTP